MMYRKCYNHAQKLKGKYSGEPLDIQTCQTERKTAILAKVQLCGYENQAWKVLVVASCFLCHATHDCDPYTCTLHCLLGSIKQDQV